MQNISLEFIFMLKFEIKAYYFSTFTQHTNDIIYNPKT